MVVTAVLDSTIGTCSIGTSRTRLRLRRFSDAPEPTKSETNSDAGLDRIASGVSYWAILDCSWRMAMRSPILIASSMSWVTNTIVLPMSAWMRRNSFWRRSRVIGSVAPNGSSMSITGGSAAIARATPTRCCWPPESSLG